MSRTDDAWKAWTVIVLALMFVLGFSLYRVHLEDELNDKIDACLAQDGTPIIVPQYRWVSEMRTCVLP